MIEFTEKHESHRETQVIKKAAVISWPTLHREVQGMAKTSPTVAAA